MFRWLLGGKSMTPSTFPDPAVDLPADGTGERTAVLAGGCFWCTEAVFKELAGVRAVRPGYAGGTAETADYRTVCSGTTGHAEAIAITYDPGATSYGELLKVFFSVAHDPTQLNRQGNDRGPQYRSAVFYEAEDYHTDYAARNPSQPYIVHVSAPKVAKLRKTYPQRLKAAEKTGA